MVFNLKVLVMSDTHGDAFVIDQVIKNVGLVDAIFHCGDSELDVQHESLQSIHIVRGNCDMDSSFPNEVITEIKGTKIYMTHGHLFQVKDTMIPIKLRAQEVGTDVVLFGHSHLLGAEILNGTLFLNPGSLTFPRGRKEKSYAIVEKSVSRWTLTFFSDTHEKIDDAIFKIPKN